MGVISLPAVDMVVLVRSIPQCPAQPPDKIEQPESDQEPGGQIAAERLQNLYSGDGDAQGDSKKAQHNRASDMPETAQKGNPGGLGRGPLSRPGHHDEGQIVVGPQQGVKQSNRGRCEGEDGEFVGHSKRIEG